MDFRLEDGKVTKTDMQRVQVLRPHLNTLIGSTYVQYENNLNNVGEYVSEK